MGLNRIYFLSVDFVIDVNGDDIMSMGISANQPLMNAIPLRRIDVRTVFVVITLCVSWDLPPGFAWANKRHFIKTAYIRKKNTFYP